MKQLHDVIWWHVYPLGFLGAERTAGELRGEVHHRLARLEPWLDYAAGLGCTGLALGPIFASETHGYDTVDHFRIDPRLGDEGDFDRLVAAAHRRGLRILLDGVFNHVGRSFPRFSARCATAPIPKRRVGFICIGARRAARSPMPRCSRDITVSSS